MIAAVVLASALLIFGGAMLYQATSVRRDRRVFPAPGCLLEIDGCRFHLHQQGAGTPTVVLEAGLAATSLSWSYVQPAVAKFARVLSYDRAGLGWSEACPQLLTLEGMTEQLEQLLACAGVSPPYILVGHSFGALLIRTFAHRNPQTVGGIVLVDPVSIDTWAKCSVADLARLSYGAKLSRRGAWLARFGVVRLTLAALAAGQRTVPRLIGRASAGRGNETLKRLVGEIGKLPSSVLPAVRSHWSMEKSFRSMAAHLECLPEAAAHAARKTLPPHIPLIILSAQTATKAELCERDSWATQAVWARHVRVPNSGHWLHLEKPPVVVAAIRELCERQPRIEREA